VPLKAAAGGRLLSALSEPWLHALLPLLLFRVVMGLKAAFVFPVGMPAEKRLVQVVWILIAIAGLHGILMALDVLAQRGIIGGFPEDEEDEGPQVLGLFQ
jgi:hypothetical protein